MHCAPHYDHASVSTHCMHTNLRILHGLRLCMSYAVCITCYLYCTYLHRFSGCFARMTVQAFESPRCHRIHTTRCSPEVTLNNTSEHTKRCSLSITSYGTSPHHVQTGDIAVVHTRKRSDVLFQSNSYSRQQLYLVITCQVTNHMCVETHLLPV